MKSVEELRTEARRLHETIRDIPDTQLKYELTERAFLLMQCAEALERSIENPDIIQSNIRRYRYLLAQQIRDPVQKRIVEEMLADATAMLDRLRKGTP